MDIDWNKFNLKVGEVVILDKKYRNSSEVKILAFTPNKLYATVKSADGHGEEWQTMTNRLTPKE